MTQCPASDTTTLLWIQNFLTTRTQKVVVDGSFSDTAHVGSGVPQGTVLGPMLFLCYIVVLLIDPSYEMVNRICVTSV